VPVVLGAADYSIYAPTSAYVNALNYPKPKDLAEYLSYLSENSNAYKEFFAWKKYIRKDPTLPDKSSYLCEICARAQLESFTGVVSEQFTNHASSMGMYENCMGMRSQVDARTGEKRFVFSRDSLEMKYY
jgi:hypothetical protein